MKMFILLGILLMPCLLHAATNCKIVEYGDHYDVSCIGDEKSAPAPVSTQPALTDSPVETAPVAAQQGVSTPYGVTADSAAPAMQAHSAPQTVAPQPTVLHRQGRPPKSVMDEARAMRDQAIQEQLQQQSKQYN